MTWRFTPWNNFDNRGVQRRVALIRGTADRGTAEPAEPREITSFFFATYIPGIRLQLISLLCIDPDFFLHDSTKRK